MVRKQTHGKPFFVPTWCGKIFVLGLVGIIGVETFFLLVSFLNNSRHGFSIANAPKHATIELLDDGFHPAEVTIKNGGTVTFTSKTGGSFWPASNIHPTHEIYPEFDPQKPLEQNESWSFTFAKEGRWRYHDHIHASYTGVLVVLPLSPTKDWDVAQAASVCRSENGGAKQQCWDEQLAATLAQRGLDAAFDVFIELYKTEPSIAKGCHGWGHVLGEGAYALFASKKDFVIPDEASYCGYGFYHGFLEKLLQDTGDPKGAIAFCAYASERADPRHAGSVYGNCIHGIGHGGTSVAAEDPANWGKIDAVLAAGKKTCASITDLPGELESCWEGVFNEFQQNINSARNGFSYDIINDDFFGICRREEEKYKRACYFEFIGLIAQFTHRDFRKSAEMVIKDIPDHDDAAYLMVKMAADFMQDDIVSETYDKNVLDCRSLPAYLHQSCFDGVLLGFTAHGEPGQEYVKGLGLCRSDILNVAERTQCYQKLLANFSGEYPREKIARICDSVDEAYQKYCRL